MKSNWVKTSPWGDYRNVQDNFKKRWHCAYDKNGKAIIIEQQDAYYNAVHRAKNVNKGKHQGSKKTLVFYI